MRWIALAMLLGCGGSADSGCNQPCGDATMNYPVYLCDGGPCPPGGAVAAQYWQCLCTANGVTHSLVFPEPTAAACGAAKANWTAFADANCH